jgi:hypothetical protein
MLRPIFALLTTAATLLVTLPASAQDPLDDGPRSLVISYRASAAHRPAFRQYLIDTLAPRLRAMEARHALADFRIFYSWYHQPTVWDAMVILRFPSFGAVGTWNKLEETAPGGLDAAGLALGEPVSSYSSDLAWSRNPDHLSKDAVYYVIPYEYSNEGEYRDYVQAYVQPQFDGWMRAGVLDGYELYMNRYGTGAPWDSLFIQHYHDMAAFGQRQKITASVRATLRDDPAWKAWSDKKAGIRTESENSIATLIAEGQ